MRLNYVYNLILDFCFDQIFADIVLIYLTKLLANIHQ